MFKTDFPDETTNKEAKEASKDIGQIQKTTLPFQLGIKLQPTFKHGRVQYQAQSLESKEQQGFGWRHSSSA